MTADPGRAPLLVVTGPTACGKSALSLRLARDLAGEIVNIDSVQVFKGFDIGSAKLLPAQRQGIVHHLLDVRDPADDFNVADYLDLAEGVIEQAEASGRRLIFCGGTGMYVTALFEGLDDIPGADENLRAELEKLTDEELTAQLVECDPVSAGRIHKHDRLRLVRALEVYRLTGRPLSELHRRISPGTSEPSPGSRTTRLGLFLVMCWARNELYRRIDQRVEQMISQGLIDEVKGLIAGYGPKLHGFRSLGYAQGVQWLKHGGPQTELSQAIAQATRRFAKRQLTYWRNEPLKRGWQIKPDDALCGEAGSVQNGARSRAKEKSFRALPWSYKELLRAVEQRLAAPFAKSEVWYIDAQRVEGGASEIVTEGQIG